MNRSLNLAACALLAACAGGTSLKPLSTRDSVEVPAPRAATGSRYAIDPGQSSVKVFVFRSGALAHLGHNHVVRFPGIRGQVHLVEEGVSESWLNLEISLGNAVVDDATDRQSAGRRFDTSPTEKDVAGTLTNMLSAKVLDAQTYPAVMVESVRVAGSWPDLLVDVRVTVRSVSREFTVPVTVAKDPYSLTANGRFALSQAELGMTAFSVLGGALAVSEVLEFEFRIVAAPAA